MATAIKVNDTVAVIAGKEKGKRGRVLMVLPAAGRVIVEKVNFIKRHTKPSQKHRQGGIIEKEAPIHVSNLALVDPKTDKKTRIGFRVLEDGRKVRIAKSGGGVIEVGAHHVPRRPRGGEQRRDRLPLQVVGVHLPVAVTEPAGGSVYRSAAS